MRLSGDDIYLSMVLLVGRSAAKQVSRNCTTVENPALQKQQVEVSERYFDCKDPLEVAAYASGVYFIGTKPRRPRDVRVCRTLVQQPCLWRRCRPRLVPALRR